MVGIGFGIFETRNWRRIRREIQKQVREANKMVQAARKSSVEIGKMEKQALNTIDYLRTKIEKLDMKSFTAETPEIKATLEEFDNTLDILEKQGIQLKPEDYITRARNLVSRGKLNEALRSLDETLKLDPDNSEAWNGKGYVYSELKMFEDSINAYRRAVDLNPKNDAAWNNLGSELGRLGHYEASLNAIEKAIKIDPRFAQAWHNRGLSLRKLGKADEALKAMKRAIKLKPDYSDAWYMKALILYEQKNFSRALADMNKAIRLDSEDARAWLMKARLHMEFDQNENALEAFKEAIKLDPNAELIWRDYGSFLLIKMNKLKEALSAYNKAIALNDNSDIAWYNKACIHSRLSEKEKSIASLRRAIELNPQYKELAKTDSDFDNIRNEDEFNNLLT